jgi:hypothetical protein
MRSRYNGMRRGHRRRETVAAHPFVAGVDGRCAACPLSRERTDVHGLPAAGPAGGAGVRERR